METNIEEEIWKDVVGYEEYYQISNFGSVLSKYSNKLLNPFIQSRGYFHVTLHGSGGQKRHAIHRIVAFHFVTNHGGFNVVNHVNGDKLDNHYKNLEWTTTRANLQHSHYVLNTRIKRFGELNHQKRLKNNDVLEIRELAKKGTTQQCLAIKYNVDQSMISRIIKRTRWPHI